MKAYDDIIETSYWAQITYFSTIEQILVVRTPLKSESLVFRYSKSSFVNALTLLLLTRAYTSSRALLRIDISVSCLQSKKKLNFLPKNLIIHDTQEA